MWRKKSEFEIKQPQELYCSNKKCLNEISKFHPMFDVLDKENLNEYILKNYCFDCIVSGNFDRIMVDNNRSKE